MVDFRDEGILLYIIKYCKRVEEKVAISTRESLDEDKDITEIICFNILQIGESAKKLSDSFIQEYNEIPWKYIKGMRDKVAHGYGSVDLEQVWKAAANDVKPLREYCERILNENK